MNYFINHTSPNFFIDFVDNKPGKTDELHHHGRVEIYYLENGMCTYIMGDSIYTLNPGDVIIIPPGVFHRTDYKKKRRSRFLILCENDYIPKSLHSVLLSSPQVISCQFFKANIKNSLDSLLSEYEKNDQYSEDAIRSILGALLISLIRSKEEADPLKSAHSFVEKAVKFINNNYSTQITLPDVAKHCMVCPEYLSRAFKKHTGFGFNEYLTSIRINNAEKMILQHPEKSISEIAFACGFNDSNYFSSRFKKVAGISPSQLAKLQKKH